LRGIATEPEEQFLPYLPFGLDLFGSLESLEESATITNAVGNVETLAFECEFLSNISEVSGFLVGLELELAVEDVRESSEVVHGVSVHLELALANHTLAREVAIEHVIGHIVTGLQQNAIVADISQMLE